MSCPVPIWALDHMNVTTDSQFEFDDQFMPRCITTKADQATIDVHLGTNGEKLMIDQPISNNEQTPLPTRRIRRPGPYNTSSYLTNFRSSAGTVVHQVSPTFFELKHPFIFDLISGDKDIMLWDAFHSWIRDELLTKHDKKNHNHDHYKKNLAEFHVAINLGVLLIDNKNWFYNLYFKGQLSNNLVRVV
uniref:Ubiquitin-like protease family profile domain-containing protein n=1 Tax=Solanum lycopersicum TaxID=4081 RepID=A0A3Q7JA62_SOLLC